MEKHILSKSTYIKGEQCLKQLYLTKKQPKLRDRIPAERLAVFNRGTQVGLYAQDLFPGGTDAGPKHYSQYRKAVELTAKLMNQGQKVIYEAAFQAHKTLILLDILVRNKEGWDAYEVKSSIKLSETYYKDAALQYHVLIEAGVKIKSFSLIHINADYIRKKEIDIHKLFIIRDVTDEVINREKFVSQKIEEELAVLNTDNTPDIDIGPHCFAPYDCDFIGHCWKSVKKPSIFNIPSLSKAKQFSLYKTYKSLSEIEHNQSLDTISRMQIHCIINKTNYTNPEAIKEHIPKFSKAYILKTLHFRPAIPIYDNTKPYESMCFGFALQTVYWDGRKGEVVRYLSMGKSMPNQELASKLKEVITENIPIFTYSNRGAHTKSIATIDLSELLINGYFYRPKITKDYSTKSLAIAMGIQTPFKAIEMDIVAAQYYEDVLNNHKDAMEKVKQIGAFLDRELRIISAFLFNLTKVY